MIQTSQVHHCCGSQQYLCRECGASKLLTPKAHYSEERKAEVLRACQERSSLWGLNRTFGISRKMITQRLKKTLKEWG